MVKYEVLLKSDRPQSNMTGVYEKKINVKLKRHRQRDDVKHTINKSMNARDCQKTTRN